MPCTYANHYPPLDVLADGPDRFDAVYSVIDEAVALIGDEEIDENVADEISFLLGTYEPSGRPVLGLDDVLRLARHLKAVRPLAGPAFGDDPSFGAEDWADASGQEVRAA
jgi:hypothetical protein